MKILILSDFLPDHRLRYSENFEKMLEGTDAIIFNLEGSPLLPEVDRNVPVQIMPFEVEKLLNFFYRFGKEKFHVALANNHILDNGVLGFDYLLSEFEKHSISYFGTKSQPHITIEDVAFLNFVTAETVAKRETGEARLNYLFYNTEKINCQIRGLENQFEKLILYPHWGRDMDTTVFRTYDRKIVMNKKWKVFGHHTHVITGIEPDRIYSMGNTYIPHPYYFDTYEATHYGLAINLDTSDLKYSLFTTSLSRIDNEYLLDVDQYCGLHESVLEHGKNFGLLKKIFLNLFSFRGNFGDKIKLGTLQMLTNIFALKYKLSKK